MSTPPAVHPPNYHGGYIPEPITIPHWDGHIPSWVNPTIAQSDDPYQVGGFQINEGDRYTSGPWAGRHIGAEHAALRELIKSVTATRIQIQTQEDVQKDQISQALRLHTATLMVNQAFRGSASSRSTEAHIMSGYSQADKQFATVGFNSAAQYGQAVTELNAQSFRSQQAANPYMPDHSIIGTLLQVASIAAAFA